MPSPLNRIPASVLDASFPAPRGERPTSAAAPLETFLPIAALIEAVETALDAARTNAASVLADPTIGALPGAAALAARAIAQREAFLADLRRRADAGETRLFVALYVPHVSDDFLDGLDGLDGFDGFDGFDGAANDGASDDADGLGF